MRHSVRMTRSRLLVPLVVGVAVVLLGIVVARVVAQDDAPAGDFTPVTVPTSTSSTPTPDPTPSPTPSADDDDDDDDFERVPQTPRPIDDDDDDRDDRDDRDDDDD